MNNPADYLLETDYDTHCNIDGTVSIERRVWRTKISGRGREHRSTELAESETWQLASPREAYKLATDIFETLVFYPAQIHSEGEE